MGLTYVLNSAIVRPDILSKAEYDLCFATERRSDTDRALHPEFVDVLFFCDRRSSGLLGPAISSLILDGVRFHAGAVIDIIFTPPHPTIRVLVEVALFLLATSPTMLCPDGESAPPWAAFT